MADEYDDPDSGDLTEPEIDEKERNRRGYEDRKLKKENESLKARLAELERGQALRDAGLDPKDPKVEYFAKAYDGELTAEAVKKEAERIGLISPQAPPPPPSDTPEGQQTLQTQQRIADAAGGATPPTSGLAALQQEQLDAFNSGDGNNTAALLEVLAKQGFPISQEG